MDFKSIVFPPAFTPVIMSAFLSKDSVKLFALFLSNAGWIKLFSFIFSPPTFSINSKSPLFANKTLA